MVMQTEGSKPDILFLVDYRNNFYSRVGSSYEGLTLDSIVSALAEHGFKSEIRAFCSPDLLDEDMDGVRVIYQSSEDIGLFYKGYIEDILLGLQNRGAILVPDFDCFRAHHNKVFMEILRQTSNLPELTQPRGWTFGTYEDFLKLPADSFDFPIVVKPSAGTKSSGVALAQNYEGLKKLVRRASWSPNLLDLIRRAYFALRRKDRTLSLHRNKFVLQSFVPGLTGDYKVLVYWDRAFVLRRDNRANDFRASGSGKFSYEPDVPHGLLDAALRIRQHFDAPMISLDVAWKDETPYVFEFQFVMFGSLTLVNSPFHFRHMDGQWTRHDGTANEEDELSQALIGFLKGRAA